MNKKEQTEKKRGIVNIFKMDFSENEFAIGVGMPFSCGRDSKGNWHEVSTNTNTKAFRIFMNQCVGKPNMTLFKKAELRDERYEKGKKILLDAGYDVVEAENGIGYA